MRPRCPCSGGAVPSTRARWRWLLGLIPALVLASIASAHDWHKRRPPAEHPVRRFHANQDLRVRPYLWWPSPCALDVAPLLGPLVPVPTGSAGASPATGPGSIVPSGSSDAHGPRASAAALPSPSPAASGSPSAVASPLHSPSPSGSPVPAASPSPSPSGNGSDLEFPENL